MEMLVDGARIVMWRAVKRTITTCYIEKRIDHRHPPMKPRPTRPPLVMWRVILVRMQPVLIRRGILATNARHMM